MADQRPSQRPSGDAFTPVRSVRLYETIIEQIAALVEGGDEVGLDGTAQDQEALDVEEELLCLGLRPSG